jgi:hypothetical protein
MSPLNIFLPGWTMLPTPIPDAPSNEEPSVDDSPDWSITAANEAAELRYADYCDKKYDDATPDAAPHRLAES